MARTSPTFYVFHGKDEYSIAAQVKKMRDQMGDDLNITEIADPKTAPAEVIAAVSAMPFLADRRLVIVSNMLDYLGKRGASKNQKAILSDLVKALPNLPSSARLVFVEQTTLAKSHPVVKLVGEDPSGYIKEFSAPKNPIAWLQKRAKSYGVEIHPRAAHALSSVIDNDLRRGDNELDKLAAYVGEGGTISEEHVALLTTYIAEASIFDMVDALGERNGRRAMQLLHQKIDIEEIDPFQIFGMIVRQFRYLLQARELIDAGGNAATLTEKLGLHPFPAKKVAAQAKGFSQAQLERIYENLLEIDVGVKSGRVDMVTGLDLFVGGVTGGT